MHPCNICGKIFQVKKLWKNHMAAEHESLSVMCPWCWHKAVFFKRVGDLKTHVQRAHQQTFTELPLNIFQEAPAFYLGKHPDMYRQLVTPASIDSTSAKLLRVAMVVALRELGPKCPISKDKLLKGWNIFPEETTEEFSDYQLTHVNLEPNLYCDFTRNFNPIRVYISDAANSDPKTIRTLTRRKMTLTNSSPHYNFTGTISEDNLQKAVVATLLGIDCVYISAILADKIIFTATPLLDEVGGEASSVNLSGRIPENMPTFPQALPCTASSTPSINSSFHSWVSHTTTTVSSVDPDQSSPSVCSPVCGDIPKSTSPSTPVCIATTCTLNFTYSAANSIQVTPASVIKSSNLPIFKRPAPYPTKNKQSQVLSSQDSCREPHQAGPSPSYRAFKLISKGAMPLLPPARRNWDTTKVTLIEGDLSIDWPPSDWKQMSPDQRLFQVEIVAHKILQARKYDMTCMSRSLLLDTFNFLILPGSKCPAAKDPNGLARLGLYEIIRSIYLGQFKDLSTLQMLEKAATLRDTTNDAFLNKCCTVPLRLGVQPANKPN